MSHIPVPSIGLYTHSVVDQRKRRRAGRKRRYSVGGCCGHSSTRKPPQTLQVIYEYYVLLGMTARMILFASSPLRLKGKQTRTTNNKKKRNRTARLRYVMIVVVPLHTHSSMLAADAQQAAQQRRDCKTQTPDLTVAKEQSTARPAASSRFNAEKKAAASIIVVLLK